MVTVEDLRKNQEKQLVKYVLAACRVVGVDNITIAIVDLPNTKAFRESYIDFIAVTKPSDIPGVYYLYLQPGKAKETYIAAIAHEAVHLQQFVTGRLVVSSDNKSLVFDGEIYYPPYDRSQPHEKEAFAKQGDIKTLMKKIIKMRHV